MDTTRPADTPGSHSPDAADDEVVDAELVPDDPAPTAATGPGPGWDQPMPGLDYTDAGVPTLDYVRDKVAGRLGTAQGAAELAESAADRGKEKTMAQQQADREQAAVDRLAQIRESLRRQ